MITGVEFADFFAQRECDIVCDVLAAIGIMQIEYRIRLYIGLEFTDDRLAGGKIACGQKHDMAIVFNREIMHLAVSTDLIYAGSGARI